MDRPVSVGAESGRAGARFFSGLAALSGEPMGVGCRENWRKVASDPPDAQASDAELEADFQKLLASFPEDVDIDS